jgi:capsular polysaccharide transport system permease protein
VAPTAPAERTSAQITFAVWRALFLREALFRVEKERAAWAWLLLDPIFHMAFLMFLYSTIRVRVIGGIDTLIWLFTGLLAFYMFRRTGQQAMNAIGPSRGLFVYRQVKPVDPVIVRACLEGFLTLIVILIMMVALGLYGLDVLPADPLSVLAAYFGLWLSGLGFGLTMSVATELLPELSRFVSLVLQPLYIFSGVMLPLANIPPPYRQWLMLNPLAHGVEAARLGYAPHYKAVPELYLPYLLACAVGAVFFGLALHIRFARRLAAL